MSKGLYIINDNFAITPEGGFACKYTNDTGAASVKGTLVDTSGSVDNGVTVEGADGLDPIGAMWSDGVANGSSVWVVIGGPAYVLLQDSTAATRGYWVRTSETAAGRADATNAAPSGGTIGALEDHMCEIGHAMESVAGGTDVLALVHLHFN